MNDRNRGLSALILLVIAAVIIAGVLAYGIHRLSATQPSLNPLQAHHVAVPNPPPTSSDAANEMTSTYNMKYGYEFQATPNYEHRILVYPIFASKDPQNYINAEEVSLPETYGTTTINGLSWIKFNYASNTIAYYIYYEGEAIRIMEVAPGLADLSSTDITALSQVVSSFHFVSSTARLDNQIAALKVGQKFGNLTVSKIILESDERGEVDFTGQLTLTGSVDVEGMFQEAIIFGNLDSSSLSEIPVIGCLCWYAQNVQISLDGVGSSTKQQWENGLGWRATTSIVIDNLQEHFVLDESEQPQPSNPPVLWSAVLYSARGE